MDGFDFRASAVLPDHVVRAVSAALEVAVPRFGLLLGSMVRREAAAAAGEPERVPLSELDVETSSWFHLEHGGRGERGVALLADELVVRLAEVIMGGPGMASDRLPTPLEASIVARRLSAALEPVVAALEEFGIRRLELAPTTPDELHAAPELVRIALDVLVGEVQGVVDLCLPVSLFVASPETTADLQPPAPQVAAALGNVPVTIAVRFEPVVLRASDVEGLAVGDVIRLDHPVDRPLVGEVDGTPLVLAQAGRRGRRLAVEVVRRV